MPGSSTTPGRLGARDHAPSRVAFRIRNGVGTRDMNLCEAQWLACVLPCRRFATALTDDCARLEADVGRYSFIVSDLDQLLVAGLPPHCERIWTLPTSWHRLRGHNQLPKIIMGVKFNSGIEVVRSQAQTAAA